MSGRPRSRMTRSTSPAARRERRAPAGQPADGVALAVEHAHEPRGDRLVVLHDQDPGQAHDAQRRRRPRAVAREFDRALTCARGRALTGALLACAAMTPEHLRRRSRVAAVLLRWCVAGCGGSSSSSSARRPSTRTPSEVSPPGDIPDNQAFVAYTPPGAGYSVKVPEGWARTAAGGAVTFTDKLNSIRLEAAAAAGGADRRREARATRAAEARARSVKGFKPGKVDRGDAHGRHGGADHLPRRRAGRPGDRQDAAPTRSSATSSSTRASEVVLTLSGPKGADNVDPWRIVTDSLRWTR